MTFFSLKTLSIVAALSFSLSGLSQTRYVSCEPFEIPACFDDEPGAWEKFLSENVNTDIGRFNCAPDGIYCVEILFLIDRDGTIIHIRKRTNNGFGFEDELIRVIKLSHRWMPASRNGRNMREFRVQTFIFNSLPQNSSIYL